MMKSLMLFSLLSTSVMAQEGAAANPMTNFLPIIMIFGIVYFLMIRPQKKQLEAEKSMMSGLNKGDEIYTKSGILGTIVGMTEKVITLEVSEGFKIKVLKSQIGGLSAKLFEKKEEKKS
ncbi:MAG: preprotein translocase subunit YajC [Halobacteriovoraceae bacterium]|nr:preprotein translocase subunit YajC [Halobacteriovoraceae bacterium]